MRDRITDKVFVIDADHKFAIRKMGYNKPLYRNTTTKRYRPQHQFSPQRNLSWV